MSIQSAELTVTLEPTVCSIGINDVEALKLPKTASHRTAIRRWHHMLDRVVNRPEYAHVTIDPSWLVYSNFAKWFDSMVNIYGSTDFDLDKDLLTMVNGSGSVADRLAAPAVYGPKTCLPVHRSLNVALTQLKGEAFNLTRGVRHKVRSDGVTIYRAKYGTHNLGSFTTDHEAAYALILHRTKMFNRDNHLELKKLHDAGLIGCKGDTLSDIKARLLSAALSRPDYSIMEDTDAPILRVAGKRGKPLEVSPLRKHHVVRIDHRNGNRIKVSSHGSAQEAVEALNMMLT